MQEFFIFLTAIPIFYIIAELFRRTKHIGKRWAFWLLITGLPIGIIAIITSPSTKNKPTKGTKIHNALGWILINFGVINLIIGLIATLEEDNLNQFKLISPAFIVLGAYLIALSNGKVINKNPKHYFNKIQSSNNLEKVISKFSSNNSKNLEIPISDFIYYIIENNLQSEPLSITQLKNKKITENTLVWRNGLENWIKAKDLKEIENIIHHTPPPIPKDDLKVNSKTAENTEIYILNGTPYTFYELLESFKKGNYLSLKRDSKIVFIYNDNYKCTTTVTLNKHKPLEKLLDFFPPETNHKENKELIKIEADKRIQINPETPISIIKIIGISIVVVISLCLLLLMAIGLSYLVTNGFSYLRLGDYVTSFLIVAFLVPLLFIGIYLIKLSYTSKIVSEDERIIKRKKIKKSIKLTIMFYSPIILVVAFIVIAVIWDWNNLGDSNSLNKNEPAKYFPKVDSTVNVIDNSEKIPDSAEKLAELQQKYPYPRPNESSSIETEKKYSFVIIETEDPYIGETEKIATGIFETSQFITEDEKYKLLDKVQENAQLKLIRKNIIKRELKSYDSYAEASKARENL